MAVGFATGALPSFTWARFEPLLPDTPISALYHPIVQLSHNLTNARIALAGITIALAFLFLQWSAFLRTSRLVIPVACFTLCALAGTTTYTFFRFFDTNGQSGRPITQSEAGINDFIDERVGAQAGVTIVPYPVSSNYFVSQGFWRDMEFWNKSVDRDAHYPGPGVFESTGIWFPKTYLQFNERSGAVNVSPTQYVAQGSAETRFRISGAAIANQQGVLLVRALIPWRLDWLTFGLYDDGWTQPDTTVSVRIFSARGEKHAVIRGVHRRDGGAAEHRSSSYTALERRSKPAGYSVGLDGTRQDDRGLRAEAGVRDRPARRRRRFDDPGRPRERAFVARAEKGRNLDRLDRPRRRDSASRAERERDHWPGIRRLSPAREL